MATTPVRLFQTDSLELFGQAVLQSSSDDAMPSKMPGKRGVDYLGVGASTDSWFIGVPGI